MLKLKGAGASADPGPALMGLIVGELWGIGGGAVRHVPDRLIASAFRAALRQRTVEDLAPLFRVDPAGPVPGYAHAPLTLLRVQCQGLAPYPRTRVRGRATALWAAAPMRCTPCLCSTSNIKAPINKPQLVPIRHGDLAGLTPRRIQVMGVGGWGGGGGYGSHRPLPPPQPAEKNATRAWLPAASSVSNARTVRGDGGCCCA